MDDNNKFITINNKVKAAYTIPSSYLSTFFINIKNCTNK